MVRKPSIVALDVVQDGDQSSDAVGDIGNTESAESGPRAIVDAEIGAVNDDIRNQRASTLVVAARVLAVAIQASLSIWADKSSDSVTSVRASAS